MIIESVPSKIIFLGEHTVLHGSSAIALPCNAFNAQLSINRDAVSPHAKLFNNWCSFVKKDRLIQQYIDLERWQKEANFLHINSNIPIGYGLGSSGAITALIAKYYGSGLNTQTPDSLKNLFGKLENFFHGKSSGIDPLVSYSSQSILLTPNKEAKIIDNLKLPLSTAEGAWFLLDSGKQRDGKKAIAYFSQKVADKTWKKKVLVEFEYVIEQLITSYLATDYTTFFEYFITLSNLQFTELKELIPKNIQKIWKDLSNTNKAYLKICGAGAGGYFLGYTPNKTNMADYDAIIWL